MRDRSGAPPCRSIVRNASSVAARAARLSATVVYWSTAMLRIFSPSRFQYTATPGSNGCLSPDRGIPSRRVLTLVETMTSWRSIPIRSSDWNQAIEIAIGDGYVFRAHPASGFVAEYSRSFRLKWPSGDRTNWSASSRQASKGGTPGCSFRPLLISRLQVCGARCSKGCRDRPHFGSGSLCSFRFLRR